MIAREQCCLYAVMNIKKILKNEVYTGSIVQGKEKKLNYNQLQKMEREKKAAEKEDS